jgi:UDP-N-acetylmuramyl pentapeptide phosphotransferase/UDP-N-acetylglucosamine-1-phosphate transferase
MHYLIIIFLLFFCELLYFKIADRYNIIDKPNHRSSHTKVTIRGGGVIFPIAVLVAFVLGYTSLWLTLAVFLVAIVSFIDDIRPLHQLPRFTTQIIAFLLVAYDLHLFDQALWVLPVVMVFLIGWINAFNFMDGINGISVLYALSAIISFSLLPVHNSTLPLLITVGFSCLVFGFFNVRTKAKAFAGDVGSITMALFLGYLMIKTIVASGNIGYILFFSLYGIDAIVTIAVRIKKKENIFEPHRSHLYQYLANEYGYAHILIAAVYVIVQLVVNFAVLYLENKKILTYSASLSILLLLTVVYLYIRAKVFKEITLEKINGF